MNNEAKELETMEALEVAKIVSSKLTDVYEESNLIDTIEDEDERGRAVQAWLQKITKAFGHAFSEILSNILRQQVAGNHEEAIKLGGLMADTADEYFSNYMTWYAATYPANATVLMMRLEEANGEE